MKPEGIDIRLAAEQDAAALQAIKAPYVEQTAINFAYQPPSVEEFSSEIRETLKHHPFIVAEKSGELLGYAQAEPHRTRDADAWSAEVSIYLAQEAQGRRVGSALYQALFNVLALQNVQNAYACITACNTRSIAFHERMGFAQVGLFPKAGYKLGAWHDTVWMWKALGDRGEPAPFIPLPLVDRNDVERALHGR